MHVGNQLIQKDNIKFSICYELKYLNLLLSIIIINILTRERKTSSLYYNSWVVLFLIFEKIFVTASVSTFSVHQNLLIFKS